MCGIYGYIGEPVNVVPLAADALRTMEYRGYDSWGIGWDDGDRFAWQKQPGRVPTDLDQSPVSGLAIGHTRWATHGRVTAENAHPHFDQSGQIGIVHNGIIENIEDLRASLNGTRYVSETDSEIVAHLVSRRIAMGDSLPAAVKHVFQKLAGSNAIVVAHRPSRQIVAITSRSPLRLGRQRGTYHLASDPQALSSIAEEIAVIPDRMLLVLGLDGVSLRDIDTEAVVDLVWEKPSAELHTDLGHYAHFTLKEIHDQPSMLRAIETHQDDVRPLADAMRNSRHLILTGCGSAFYAASLGAEMLRKTLPETWIDVIPASEIDSRTRNCGKETLMVAHTQSGETADVVDAVHSAHAWGSTVATLVNTVSSTTAGQADIVVPLMAGVERSVLATKSLLAMVMRHIQIASELAGEGDSHMTDVAQAMCEIDQRLGCETLNELASRLTVHDHVLTLGKSVGHKVALEAALKIKEGSYIHAEAFLTGELKHGPLALISEGMPCLLFATTPTERDGARIASREIMSRGGYTVGIGEFDASDCSEILWVPECGKATSLVHLVIAQIVAYHIAICRGVDPDFPRNLAKSVTVR